MQYAKYRKFYRVSMTREYIVIHTPGAFGNFISYLIDCHQQNCVLPSPFVESGASHARRDLNESLTLDMVFPEMWNIYKEKKVDKKVIGCVWQTQFFSYILHAYYGRTNIGQYSKCGVKYAEKNFYNFVKNHQQSDKVAQNIVDLKQLFHIEINEKNYQVPRNVLRMFFWMALFTQQDNVVTITNQQIKSLKDIELLDIEDIINYDRLKKFFAEKFSADIDFKQVHEKFLQCNQSLKDYTMANAVINSVKLGERTEIQQLSVIGEATVFYELEKHYFDIPFFNLVDFFKNTGDIIDYIKHYPNFMKQPNKLYCQHYKRFPNNE